MSLKIAKINFSIPAGQTQEFSLVADFYRLDLFPSGLLVGLNGGPALALTEGFSQQGTPGSGEVRLLRIENTTGGTLAGAFIHGTGEMALPGVTTLSGSVPLPTGASTAALQTSGNALLTSLDGKITGGTARVCRLRNLPINNGLVLTGQKRVGVLHNGTAGNVTVTIAGNSATLAAGEGCEFAVEHPGDTLPQIEIYTSASSVALVAQTA